MASNRPTGAKRYFTPCEANATLPLVSAIVRDIADLAHDLDERSDRLQRLKLPKNGVRGEAYQEEVRHVEAEFERDQDRMREYEQELAELGIELKDYRTGLIDFLARMDGRDVYLCWRMGEPSVSYWHELDAGFAGRQALNNAEGLGPKVQKAGS